MFSRLPRCVASTTPRCCRYSTPTSGASVDRTFETDELALPKTPTWSVHELLNSYPPTKLSDETLIRLHHLAALVPPEKDSKDLRRLRHQMSTLVKLVEAVRMAPPLPTPISAQSSPDCLDGRIWPEGKGIDLRDYKNYQAEGESSSTPPSGRELLKHASRSRNGFYVVDSVQVKE